MTIESVAGQAFVIFNRCEGAFWVAIALMILVVLCRRRQNVALSLALALLFAAFGVSDWVEIGTGGWYKPWWMLTWKATNLAALAVVFLLLRRRGKRSVV